MGACPFGALFNGPPPPLILVALPFLATDPDFFASLCGQFTCYSQIGKSQGVAWSPRFRRGTSSGRPARLSRSGQSPVNQVCQGTRQSERAREKLSCLDLDYLYCRGELFRARRHLPRRHRRTTRKKSGRRAREICGMKEPPRINGP